MKRMMPIKPFSSRRGSAMILVVAILAVLVLLSISLSYTSKMDLLSARNWANTVQSKLSAATGVPLFVTSTADSASGATVALRNAARNATLRTNAAGDLIDEAADEAALDDAAEAESRATQSGNGGDEGLIPVAMRLKLSQEGFSYARAGFATPVLATPTPAADSVKRAGAMIPATRQGSVQLAMPVNRQALDQAEQVTSFTQKLMRSIPFSNSLADVTVIDTSANFNINAVLPVDDPFKSSKPTSSALQANGQQTPPIAAPSPYVTQDMLARLIAAVAQGNNLGNVEAEELAHAIALRRFGADGAPGIAGVDDNANGRAAQAEFDGFDNDHDRQIDDLSEQHAGIAQDGLDNDRNGAIDDLQESIEPDGIDNDFDGQIDEAGEAIDDPAESSSDPRIPPAGDDRPFVSLSELMSVPGMTIELYRALEPHLTVFSVSSNAFELTEAMESGESSDTLEMQRALDEELENTTEDPKSKGWPRVDPNTGSPERIYAALKRRFPEKPTGLLAQFTVNLVDRRDTDNEPTELTIDGVTVNGIEIAPYINEVASDVSSTEEEGDNGEFIELFNPWSQSISLVGYTLRGEGVNIPLTQTLPPGGYILFTDDYDNSTDTENETGVQSGSFYDIFGAAVTGFGAQMVVTSLNIADEAGTMTLVNAAGQTVDSFAWSNGTWDGRANSFQRGDPRLRATRYAQATPLKANADFGTDATLRQQALGVQEKWQNQPFLSALDVMLVSTAYADGSSTNSSKLGGTPWALPVLLDEEGDNLDIGLVDVFAIGAVLPPRVTADTLQELNGASTSQFGQPDVQRRVRASYLTRYLQNLPRCGRSFGAININTAPPVVLASLPGMTPDLLQRIFTAREAHAQELQLEDQEEGINPVDRDWTKAGDGLETPRWRNLSDVLLDDTIWGSAALYERLDQVYAFAGLLATSSLSVEVHTADVSLESVAAAEGRRRSFSEARRIITGDRGSIETVLFEYARRGDDKADDRDLRYAVPSTEVAGLNIALMFPDFDTTKIPYGIDPFGTTPVIANRDNGKRAQGAVNSAGTPIRRGDSQSKQSTARRAGKMIPTSR